MVSLYTHKADTRGEKDHWLRKPALVVLLYEGIVANVLDFDYAPQSELIENRRIWMNVSQVTGGLEKATSLLLWISKYCTSTKRTIQYVCVPSRPNTRVVQIVIPRLYLVPPIVGIDETRTLDTQDNQGICCRYGRRCVCLNCPGSAVNC